MGQIASIQKEKKKDFSLLLAKYSSIEKLLFLFNKFSEQHFLCIEELGHFFEESSQLILLDEETSHSAQLNSTFLLSYITDFLNTFEEVGRILSSKSTELEALPSKLSVSETLTKRKSFLEENSKVLLTGMEDLGKEYEKNTSEYEKLVDRALLALNTLGNDVIKSGAAAKEEELLKKSQACQEMIEMISAYELEIGEQNQLVNTKVFSLSNLAQTGVNETKQMLTDAIGYYFSFVTAANAVYLQGFTQIQETLRGACQASNTYKSQGVSFVQEDVFIAESGLKLMMEKQKEEVEMSFEEFQDIHKSIRGDQSALGSKDVWVICACVEQYVEAFKEITQSQKKLYSFIKNKFDQMSLFLKNLHLKSQQIFKANGMASDSDSFYSLMLKTFNTQVIFEAKNFFCFHDALKKRLLQSSQAIQKSSEAIDLLIKSREKEVSFGKVSKILEMVGDLKAVYQRVSNDLHSEESSSESSGNLHLKTTRHNILNLLNEALVANDSLIEHIRFQDKFYAKIVSEECEKVYLAFLGLSDEMVVLCNAISTFHMVAQPAEANMLASIQIDYALKALFQKSFEPKEIPFKSKTDINGFLMRLKAAEEAIKKIQASKAAPSEEQPKMLSMADCFAGKITSVPPELAGSFGVSESEICKGKHACLLLKGILPRAGNLWLFEKKMCFHSTTMLSKTSLSVFWEDILSYEVPFNELFRNSLQINTKHGILTFGRFNEREEIIKALKSLGSHIQERIMTPEEIKEQSERLDIENSESINIGIATNF